MKTGYKSELWENAHARKDFLMLGKCEAGMYDLLRGYLVVIHSGFKILRISRSLKASDQTCLRRNGSDSWWVLRKDVCCIPYR
jgi:hypothetical protein